MNKPLKVLIIFFVAQLSVTMGVSMDRSMPTPEEMQLIIHAVLKVGCIRGDCFCPPQFVRCRHWRRQNAYRAEQEAWLERERFMAQEQPWRHIYGSDQ